MQKVRLTLNGKFADPEIAQAIVSAVIRFAKKRQFEVTELGMFAVDTLAETVRKEVKLPPPVVLSPEFTVPRQFDAQISTL